MTDRQFAPLPGGHGSIPDKGNTFIDPQIYGGSISGSIIDSATITNATIPWVAWTPSYANLTIGDGTVTARYFQIGSLVIARFKFVLGSTSAVGTGPTVTVPVTGHATGYDNTGPPAGSATMRDAGTIRFTGMVFLGSSGTVFEPAVDESSATHGRLATNITATIPMTWTTSDELAFTATYEAA